MKCDQCGVKVDSKGFLGGTIICKECARKEREELEE